MAIGYRNYRIKYDYHTHTTFSHGKGTIEDNIRTADEKGLKGIAITDHGPGHLLYGINKRKIPAMRAEIERLKSCYPKMEIFFAIEANIVYAGKCLDLTEEDLKLYDFVIAGYHYGVKDGYFAQNLIHYKSPIALPGRKKQMKKNTEMVVRAIYENPIKILTHPGDKGPFDIAEIAKACAARGTLLEISAWHEHLTVEEIKLAAKEDVLFVVNSDAHAADRVGSCDRGIKRAMQAGIDMNRVINIEEY